MLYRVEVKLCATAYIKADSADEALNIAYDLRDSTVCAGSGWVGDLPISEEYLDSPDLPNVSLSPAMTCYGVWGDEDAIAEEVEL
jgi:hypothetical protein